MKVERFDTRASLDAALALRLRSAIERGGGVMLSGGNTPKPAYTRLASQSLFPAKDLTLLFSDERYVPAASEASNYRASVPLIEALRIQELNVLRVRTELALDAAASDYDRRLAGLLESQGRLRLGVLGLGSDGHTASLFTLDDLQQAGENLAIAVQRPDGMQAVSVTPRLLSRIEQLLIVVPGRDKQQALTALLARDPQSVAWRAVEGNPDIEVWCERADV